MVKKNKHLVGDLLPQCTELDWASEKMDCHSFQPFPSSITSELSILRLISLSSELRTESQTVDLRWKRRAREGILCTITFLQVFVSDWWECCW